MNLKILINLFHTGYRFGVRQKRKLYYKLDFFNEAYIISAKNIKPFIKILSIRGSKPPQVLFFSKTTQNPPVKDGVIKNVRLDLTSNIYDGNLQWSC